MEGGIQVKTADKFAFAFGVLTLLGGEYIALRHVHLFPMFFTLVMVGLVAKRYPDFAAEKCQLFMIDFCYFMNLSTIIQINLYPSCVLWFKANYVLCIGSLLNAMVVWQNSLIFHSMDKLISLFLHAFAPFTLHLIRWSVIAGEAIEDEKGDYLSLVELLFYPLMMYLVWQVSYLIIIEVVLAHKIRNDPELSFSLRYLATDSNNGMHQLVRDLMRNIGVMQSDEVFDADTVKTKLIFIVAQLVYTFVTLLHVPLLYTSYNFSVFYISAIFGWTVYRGSTHYYEDFIQRYQIEVSKKKDTAKVE